MVRPPPAGAHSSPDGRHAAQADRTGDAGAVDALAVALATRCTTNAGAAASAARSRSCANCKAFEIPASAWERHVLARRIANYDPKWLDQLCLTGAVGWGRLSPIRPRSRILPKASVA